MVPEILIIILSFATRSTLASAARVSTAWSTIALDKLWSGHDVRVPDLLRMLPLYHLVNLNPPQRIWSLVQDPTEAEWARFRSYASRVRSLVFPGWDPDHFDPRITEWKVEKEVLFPRLRRIEAQILEPYAESLSQLLQFITPGLQDFSVDMDKPSLVFQSLLEVLATSEGLHLKKLKLNHPVVLANMASADALANVAVANGASIEALEISGSHLNVSLITGHSLLNLRALSFAVGRLGSGGDKHPIQVLVEGCPRVEYLRIRLEHDYPPTNILDLPGLRMILTWRLLSLDVQRRGGTPFAKANLEEMGRAWPKLKKLNLIWNREIRIELSLSRLADIVSAFPQLEELRALFYYEEEEENFLLTYQLASEERRPSRLQKFWLGDSDLLEPECKRDLVARFLAQVLSPGLRIDRDHYLPSTQDPVDLEARERAAAAGRDFDPEWDALFRHIEELQGGVPIRVGRIPEDSNGVWF